MNILLVNPPNCGRSIPEERYGIASIKQIFRGEPLALEELAGNLLAHQVHLLDLKVEPDGLERELRELQPDVVGITGMTCEANTMLQLAATIKDACRAYVVVGGIHASNDPAFFNHPTVDYIVVGIGKKVFAELVRALEEGRDASELPGVLPTRPGKPMERPLLRNSTDDLVMTHPPAYDLVSHYRPHYTLKKMNVSMGFVASAYGCPHRCSFCSVQGQTGGCYLTKSIETVIRDIKLLPDIPMIRLVDANTFGNVTRATALGRALRTAGLDHKQYLADIRSDTVVRHPEMLEEWKTAGLRAVIIGFEEINDASLSAMNKANKASINNEAIAILNAMGITIVGDFIISPEYDEEDFDRLEAYLGTRRIDLPMITVMTPLPGTPLYQQERHRIVNHDLDFYTLTNAVTPTGLDEKRFYERYATLLANSHQNARL